MKIKQNLIIFFFTACLSFMLMISLFPQSASALTVMEEAKKEYRSLIAYKAIQSCGLSEYATVKKGEYSELFWALRGVPNGKKVNVGRLWGGGDDGEIDCRDKGDMTSVVKALGYNSINEFNTAIFPTSGEGTDCSNDICNIRNDFLAKIKTKAGITDENLSRIGRYYYWMSLYHKYPPGGLSWGCKGTFTNDKAKYDAQPSNLKSKPPNDGKYYVINDKGEKKEYSYAIFAVPEGKSIEGLGLNYDASNYSTMPDQTCNQILNRFENPVFRDAVYNALEIKRQAAATNPEDPQAQEDAASLGVGEVASDDAQQSSATKPETCESANAIILSWIFCPMLSAIDGTINTLGRIIDDLLTVGSSRYDQPQLKAVWSYFRILATLLLIIIGLVMVISQAIGIGVFDAYTVKKILPRLIIGIVGIQLSWFLFTGLIGITNNIAWGIQDLMYAPFGGSANFDFKALINGAPGRAGLFSAVALGSVAAGGLALGVLGALSFALTAFLSLLMAFILLSFRSVVIVGLLLISPIAIVSWILPNTEKLWKIWWESFSKLLMMYPMIIFLIAAGRIFAWSATGGGTSGGVVASKISDITSFIAVVIGFFGPFFLIPKTFQLAGSAFANIAGIANSRSRGAFDRLKNYRGQKTAENLQKTRNFQRFSDNNRLGRATNTMLGIGANPIKSMQGPAAVRRMRQTGRTMQGLAAWDNNETIKANQNNDAFLLALADEREAQRMIAKAESERSAALASGNVTKADQKAAEIAQRNNALNLARGVGAERNSSAVRQQAFSKLAATGYQFEDGEAGYRQLSSIAQSISGGDAGQYADLMNEAQYNLKNAGRFDLAGINHGAEYDLKAGTDKASLYQLANGKKQSITAMATGHKVALSEAKSGITQEVDASGNIVQRNLSAAEINDRYMQAAVLEKELDAMLPNTTGAVRDEILQQKKSILQVGGKDYEDWKQRGSGETTPTRGPGGTTSTRQLSMEEIAGRRARAYERPDPNKI